MLNYRLSKEIYGMTPWAVDAMSLPILMKTLDNFRAGVVFSEKEDKCNSLMVYNPSSAVYVDEYSSWKLKGDRIDSNADIIGVISLDGAITKSGGASSFGTLQLSNMMIEMSKDSRVKGFIIVADSGGGSTMAVSLMQDAIQEVMQSKPVYSVIPKGSYACSACYGIISATKGIFAEDKMSIVGSTGTMMQFDGRKANTEDNNGIKHIRVYATKSVKKNEAFEEALNHDNYSLLVNELLDPMNEAFLNSIIQFRPMLSKSDFDTGKDVFTKDAVGTFIDGFKSFNEVSEMILKESKEKSKTANNNKNQNKMTREELKNSHPSVYNEIYNEGKQAGVAAERDRAGAWMAHAGTDLESVKKGIQSGNEISATEREEFLVKAANKSRIDSHESGSAAPVTTPESEGKGDVELESFYSDVKKQLI